ncbi:hypothetical protein JAAARDRAFT_170026 [Jaapia argillacea MUCL 33604]|uniref:Uncharacterized protein n=1 Tax=Jaapia argillacea MUCL 33604 TaxID=933084 RepID=A0A067QMF4_9AGAM|nr:hypothetical protein JAAARDRAFT_170026 [Jaapia argillacea MUCL 33604]
MNGDLHSPDESSPLLPNGSSNGDATTQVAPQHALPFILPTVYRIEAQGVENATDSDLCPHSLDTPSAQTAYTLLVLLHLRIGRRAVATSPYEQWSLERDRLREIDQLDVRIGKLVEQDAAEIEEALWLPFPYEQASKRTVRVMDILVQPGAPSALLSHRLILLSIMKTWRRGRFVVPGESILQRLLRRINTVCAPRVLHAIDLMAQLMSMILLIHYVVYPPTKPMINFRSSLVGVREIFLIIFSASSLVRPPPLLSWWAILVLPAFIFSLPSVPFPGETSFQVLLMALSLHILVLHLPISPSPVLLFPFERALPLSTLFWHSFSRIYYPALLFFLPAFILSAYLLSCSLFDTFEIHQNFIPSVLTFLPAPMDTRTAFLSLVILILLLFMLFTMLLVLLFPFLASRARPSLGHAAPDPWDRYTESVGLDARRAFLRAVWTYTPNPNSHSSPYFFPAPFNLAQVVLVKVPEVMLAAVGKQDVGTFRYVEGVLWWVLVMPVCVVMGAFWGWGLLN